LQLLLLDSNEIGGLIVMNVIWSHLLFGAVYGQSTTRMEILRGNDGSVTDIR